MYNLLVVDDTEINLMMTERLLSGMPVSVDTATGGEDALKLLEKKDYDLCLFDYQMPGMSGVELLNAMKNIDRDVSGSKVVAMTGTEDEKAADYFMELGFDGFLRKPIIKEELLSVLFEMLGDPIFDEGTTDLSQEEIEKIPQDIRNIPELDHILGIKNAGSARDFMSAIGIFCKDIDRNSKEIENAFSSGDMKTYTIKVHGLKSTAKMIGALKLSEMAASLEAASKSLGGADLAKDTEDMLTLYRSLHDKLKDAMKEEKHDAAAQKKIDDAYATLKDYAYAEDYDLVELILGAMENYTMPSADKDRFDRIKKCLLEFDFDGIKSILEEVG